MVAMLSFLILAAALGEPAAGSADAVTATPQEIQQVHDWVAASFADIDAPGRAPRVRVHVLRQDHSVLNFGRSCIETPMTIGARRFDHGLGTHAHSEIAVTIPQGAKRFTALVGVDNNTDTQGARGSVVFSVASGGRDLFRSDVLHGGEEAASISVDLPEGAATLLLKAEETTDGVACDQADWAEALFELEDGSKVYLDQNQSPLLFQGAEPVFSFTYGGKPSSEFLKGWPHAVNTREDDAAFVYAATWTDPATGLEVQAEAITYKKFPAANWVIHFENKGAQDTPILSDVQALDVALRTGYFRNLPIVHQLEGDACAENSFRPKDAAIEVGKELHFAPTGGRSSSISAFPFFNIEYGGQGIITAVGWTGQWAAQIDRMETGPTRMRAGMELTHFLLHPGERVRTPRVVLMPWSGDRTAAHNRWRRLLLDQFVPRIDGKPASLPVALQTFDRYNARPGWATEAGQIAAAALAHQIGCNTYWFDAAWFPGNFPNGVGNWFCKPAEFPRGLKPVSDAIHRDGMKFILWFEPERVAKGTQIAEEHPEFVFGGKGGGLFKLNDPEARQWLTELLSQRITEYGLDWYRNDFNMDPLAFWRKNDAPDRQGITEIRYIEGLYAMWDELRARHPGLLIDNCSSGGRRIDIEMCSRSVPLWRSDTNCSANHPEWNQAVTASLSLYVPLHTAAPWNPEPYEMRSAYTAGLLCQFAYLENGFSLEEAKRLVAESKEIGQYWTGDFYPLTPCGIGLDEFVAYQFHRPDLDAGIVMAFRRAECAYRGLILGLQAVNPAGRYAVQCIDGAGKSTGQEMSGAALAEDLALRLPAPKSSLLVRYERVGAR